MNQVQGEQSSLDVAGPENSDTVSAGERLKNARLTLGWSVGDVSTRLKLSAEKIEALERGAIGDIATPVFVAGYLRSYARLLELPEDEVLADFEILSSMRNSHGDTASEKIGFENDSFDSLRLPSNGEDFTKLSSSGNIFTDSKSLLMPVVLSMLLIAIVYFSVLDDEGVDDAKLAPVSSSEPETASRLTADTFANDTDETPAVPSSVVDGLSAVSEAPVVSEMPVTTTYSETDPVNEAGQEKNKVVDFHQSELTLVFNGDSWVEVTDAQGERLVYRLAKAGMSRTVTGASPFTVQLGYVPGVEIFYNGVPYDLSRFSGRRSAQFNVGNANDSIAAQ